MPDHQVVEAACWVAADRPQPAEGNAYHQVVQAACWVLAFLPPSLQKAMPDHQVAEAARWVHPAYRRIVFSFTFTSFRGFSSLSSSLLLFLLPLLILHAAMELLTST
jgi:hypothetical protein